MVNLNIKIIERCEISPPEGSVPPTLLPLSLLDIGWIFFFPMPLFFFDLPRPTDYFTLTVIPKLKHSLSLSLRQFFPLAADLVLPPPPQKPHLRFSPGARGVSFTVAESGADFNGVVSNEPRDAAECRHLVPELHGGEGEGGGAYPLLALQVTVFPNSGFTVGATFNHAAADWRAFLHFMQSWAFICRSISSSGQALTLVEPEPPCHNRGAVDRGVIVDQYGVEPVYLGKPWAGNRPDTTRGLQAPLDMVRATFLVGRPHIEKLKIWVLAQTRDHEHASSAMMMRVTSFAVTAAFTWVHLIKSQKETDKDETYYLCFLADCRGLAGIEPPIPATYFGNCVVPCFVSVKRSQVDDVENGVTYVAKDIGKAVRGQRKLPMTWDRNFNKIVESGKLVTVAGSTRMGVYEGDFGWGKARKNVSTHIDVSATISMVEAADGGGGLEIGLALDEGRMRSFGESFERSLKLLSLTSNL